MKKVFGLCIVLAAASAASFPQDLTGPAPKPVRRDAGLELWDTAMGSLWIPSPGKDVMRHLQWEQTVQKVYDHSQAHVRPGDVVIDCGAHIGGFTRMALGAGARMVVAIEPEQANVLAFQKNFEKEIASGRVRLIRKGVWDTTGRLSLHLSPVGDSHSVAIPQNGGKEESIEVTTLDALVASLNLQRVDFVKMDIEGAELKALAGARQTLLRHHPRLAISSYHVKGDPAAICTIVWQTCADYLVTSKDRVNDIPKVLFFYR